MDSSQPVKEDKMGATKRQYPCEGSGRRVSPTGSSAFPEVKCPCCHYYASPVKKYGDHQIRSHRTVKSDPYA